MAALRTTSCQIEVPEDHCVDDDDDRRLWVGNLGSEITEFAVLKLLQNFGSLGKMNFVYHKSGPDKGKPRGYCFVSFHTWEAAERARKHLDGKVVMSRTLHVKWAHRMKQDDTMFSKSKVKPAPASGNLPQQPPTVAAALSVSSSVSAASAETKIAAIEAKLQMMERTQEHFSLSSTIQPPRGLSLAPQVRGLSLVSQVRDARSTRPGPYRLPSRPRRQ